jgi:hypothetical protein
MRAMRWILPALLALAACGPAANDPTPTCTPDDEIGDDVLVATVGDAAWEANGSAQVSNAAGLNLVFTQDAQNTASIRLRRSSTWAVDDETGEAVRSDGDELVANNALAFTGDDLPIGVALGDGNDEGGDSTFAIDAGTHHSSDADGGFLLLDSIDTDAGTLLGCFFVQVGGASGDVDIDGSFRVTLP